MPDPGVSDEIVLDLKSKLDALASSIATVSADNTAAIAQLVKTTSESLTNLQQKLTALEASQFEVNLLDQSKVVLQRAVFGFGKPLKIILDK